MRRVLIGALILLMLANGGSAISGELKISPIEGRKDYYTFDWSDCTLSEALAGVYKRFNKGGIALLTPEDKFTGITKFDSSPVNTMHIFANSLRRDAVFLASTSVMYPCSLRPLQDICAFKQMELITSLTGEQLSSIATVGGIPFKSLTTAQQRQARELASVARNIGAIFPEPVFSQKLQQSKIILSLHPKMRYEYKSSGSSTTGSIRCDGKATPSLWFPWGEGQSQAWKLAEAAQTNAGEDAPGTKDKIKLAGVYTLGGLVERIMKNYPTPIKLDRGFGPLRIVAYCDTTMAGLARALALASGGEWKKTSGVWHLQISTLTNMLADYDAESCSSSQLLKTFGSDLQKLVKSGKLRIVADDEWNDADLAKTIIQCGPVSLKDLNAAQLADIDKQLANAKSISKDAPASVAEVSQLEWSPVFQLFIATDDAILYHEYIEYK